jgi:RNA polymerase sigma factor (sigma-70 family)
MCDQPVAKAVEESFRKPKAQWQAADHAIIQTWTDESLHDPHLKPVDAQRIHDSRLSYIALSELLFMSYEAMTATQRKQLYDWLKHPYRTDHLIKIARLVLLRNGMAGLEKSENLKEWVDDFIDDFFAELIKKFDPSVTPLYGYIAGTKGQFRFWCLKKAERLMKIRTHELFSDDHGLDLDNWQVIQKDETAEDPLWHPAGQIKGPQIDDGTTVKAETQVDEPLNKTTKKTDERLQRAPEAFIGKTDKNWHQCSPEEQAAYLMLLEAIDQLKPRYRDVLLLRFIEGYTNQEIAKLLQITPENVGNRLFLAKEALAALLEPSTKKH